MKRMIMLFAALLFAFAAFAQGDYNAQKRSLFEQLPIRANDIVFLGNSITDGCEWAELFDNCHVKNRGIGGDRSEWLLDRLDPIIEGHPKKLFLMIGINDLMAGVAPEEVAANVRKIIMRFLEESPWTKLYVQSILPVGARLNSSGQGELDRQILRANKLLEEMCAEFVTLKKNVLYIDIHSALADDRGRLAARYTNDGLHLMGEGYTAWKAVIVKLVK